MAAGMRMTLHIVDKTKGRDDPAATCNDDRVAESQTTTNQQQETRMIPRNERLTTGLNIDGEDDLLNHERRDSDPLPLPATTSSPEDTLIRRATWSPPGTAIRRPGPRTTRRTPWSHSGRGVWTLNNSSSPHDLPTAPSTNQHSRGLYSQPFDQHQGRRLNFFRSNSKMNRKDLEFILQQKPQTQRQYGQHQQEPQESP